MSASTGAPATPPAPMRPSPRRRTSSALTLDNHRIVTNPMEPRGSSARSTRRAAATRCMSRARASTSTATTPPARSASSRRTCASSRPMSAAASAPRTSSMPSTSLILWAARRVGRPVKWIATRSEVFLADHHGARHAGRGVAGARRRRQVPGAARSPASPISAPISPASAAACRPIQYVHLQGTVYRIPSIALHVAAVLTNTTPIGVMRGPGFAETVNILERLIDAAAQQCGFDRAELRRLNMVPADAMPMTNALRLPRRQRRLSRDVRPGAGARRPAPASPRGAGESEARGQAARPGLRLSHQGHRRLAGGECRHPLRAPTARCR